MFKKETSPPPELEYDDREEVMIEPLAGHTSKLVRTRCEPLIG